MLASNKVGGELKIAYGFLARIGADEYDLNANPFFGPAWVRTDANGVPAQRAVLTALWNQGKPRSPEHSTVKVTSSRWRACNFSEGVSPGVLLTRAGNL